MIYCSYDWEYYSLICSFCKLTIYVLFDSKTFLYPLFIGIIILISWRLKIVWDPPSLLCYYAPLWWQYCSKNTLRQVCKNFWTRGPFIDIECPIAWPRIMRANILSNDWTPCTSHFYTAADRILRLGIINYWLKYCWF